MKARGKWFGFLAALIFAAVTGLLLPEEAQAAKKEITGEGYISYYQSDSDKLWLEITETSISGEDLFNSDQIAFQWKIYDPIHGYDDVFEDLSTWSNLPWEGARFLTNASQYRGSWVCVVVLADEVDGVSLSDYTGKFYSHPMYVTEPDGDFLNYQNLSDYVLLKYLHDNADLDHNGCLSTAEAAKVKNLDLSGTDFCRQAGMKYLTGLETVDFSHTKVESMGFPYSKNLKSVDLSNTPLRSFTVYATNSKLETLRLDNIPAAEGSIKKLNLSNAKNLKELRIVSTTFQEVDISNCPYLLDAVLQGDVQSSYPLTIYGSSQGMLLMRAGKENTILLGKLKTCFPAAALRNALADQLDGDEYLSLKEARSITELALTDGAENVKSITGLTYLSRLQKLTITGTSVTKLDLSGNRRLTELVVCNNALKELDISKLTNLESLYCMVNSLTGLDLENNTKLASLECWGNQIKTLNINNCPQLIKDYTGTWRELSDGVYTYDNFTDVQTGNVLSVDRTTKIQTGPVITKQPEDQTVEYGDEVTLKIEAKGSGKTYRWEYYSAEKDDWFAVTEASGKTAEYTFKASANPIRIRYRCIISNSLGSSTSRTAVMTIKPKITENPRSVTVAPGRKVTFTVSAQGYDLEYRWFCKKPDDMWRSIDTDDGARASYTVTATEAMDGYQYYCQVYDGNPYSMSSTATLTVMRFVDVPKNAPYYDALEWAFANGIVKGTDKTHFSPNKGTTRGEFCTMLWRMNGSPALTEEMKANNPFTDIKPGKGHGTAVLWCADRGIITGYKAANGTRYFNPGGRITRTNMIVMMYKMAKNDYGAEAVKVSYSGSPYKDIKATNKNLVVYKWAYVKKISRPSSGMFEPQTNCLRWHLVFFLYRYNNVYHVK